MKDLGLKHYNQEFYLHDRGLDLGAGTTIVIKDLRMETIKAGEKEKHVRIVAAVDLVAETTLVLSYKCKTCGASPSDPDNDGLWYILENHDGHRLSFPYAEDEAHREAERDRFPVPGWRTVNDEMNCGPCADELEAAMETVKRKRRKA